VRDVVTAALAGRVVTRQHEERRCAFDDDAPDVGRLREGATSPPLFYLEPETRQIRNCGEQPRGLFFAPSAFGVPLCGVSSPPDHAARAFVRSTASPEGTKIVSEMKSSMDFDEDARHGGAR
jgi:hypothetical protein